LGNIGHLGLKFKPDKEYVPIVSASFPHPIFEKLIDCQSSELSEGYAIHRFAITDPDFKDQKLKVSIKVDGRNHGFILESHDKSQRYFAKAETRVVNSYFVSKILNRLGVKAPEPLLKVINNTLYLITRDLSRRYDKGEGLKEKKYQDIYMVDNIFNQLPSAIDKRSSVEKDHPIITKFLENHFSSIKTRISLAKINIMTAVCGISDVFEHGGNIGLVSTIKTTKEVSNSSEKFAIIDFEVQEQEDYLLPDSASEEAFIKGFQTPRMRYFFDNDCGVAVTHAPIFKLLCNALQAQDIKQAAKELAHPKKRDYKEGFLLQSSKESDKSPLQIIQEVCDEIKQELKTCLNPVELAKKTKVLDMLCARFQKKLSNVLNTMGLGLDEIEPRSDNRFGL
jgi:hypothetical protein